MSFKDQNPEAWDELINNHGYICPECGNIENFQQYWHVVKNIRQNIDTGIIEYIATDYSVMDGTQPQIAEVICAECGCQAQICKKGILLDTMAHSDYNEQLAKYSNEGK